MNADLRGWKRSSERWEDRDSRKQAQKKDQENLTQSRKDAKFRTCRVVA
jgi:hypothetical protein